MFYSVGQKNQWCVKWPRTDLQWRDLKINSTTSRRKLNHTTASLCVPHHNYRPIQFPRVIINFLRKILET